MALSPWPTDAAELTTARRELKAALEFGSWDIPEAALERVGAAASARVEKYASGAPQAVKDEALVRPAGRMIAGKFHMYGNDSRVEIGESEIEYAAPTPNLFTSSGAAGLLSPWRVRRAAEKSVLRACGIPEALYESAGATSAQQAWRQFLHAALLPFARRVEAEFREKLDLPALRLDMGRLTQTDLVHQSRIVGGLVKAGVGLERAFEIAGLGDA